MKKERKEKSFIHTPTYLGGKKAMEVFIKKNLIYPQEALQAKIEGSVHCRYRVTYAGLVDEVKIISGLGYGCDEEAIRLIELFKFELPEIPRGIKAHFHKKIRINFKLPIKKEVIPASLKSRYQYSLLAEKKNTDLKPTKENPQKIYQYTIRVN